MVYTCTQYLAFFRHACLKSAKEAEAAKAEGFIMEPEKFF